MTSEEFIFPKAGCDAGVSKAGQTSCAATLLPTPLPFLEEIGGGGGRSRSLCMVVPSSSIAISENMFIVKICAGINNVCKKEIVVAFCY